MEFERLNRNTYWWLILFICMGFISMAFSGKVIHPFLLTPEIPIEKYNYIAGMTLEIILAILLYTLYSAFHYILTLIVDYRLPLSKYKIKLTIRIILGVLIYQLKEFIDYISFGNVMPNCFDEFWFIVIWEIAPIVIILLWAILSMRKKKNIE